MNRFQTIQHAFTCAIEELLSTHPDLFAELFADLSYDDARALGREAADRAVGRLMLDHVDKSA